MCVWGDSHLVIPALNRGNFNPTTLLLPFVGGGVSDRSIVGALLSIDSKRSMQDEAIGSEYKLEEEQATGC